MHTFQISVPATGTTPLQAAAAAGSSAVQQLVRRYRVYRQRCVIANLPDHLRHDVGEIDIRPAASRIRSGDGPNVTLESLWLRYR